MAGTTGNVSLVPDTPSPTSGNGRLEGTQIAVAHHDQPATVLVVLDDQLVRSLLEQALRSVGYDVVVASMGHDARKSLRSTTVDLVLGGMTTPDAGARRALARLHADTAALGIPQIFLSAVEEPFQTLPFTASLIPARSFDLSDILSLVRITLDRVPPRRLATSEPHWEFPIEVHEPTHDFSQPSAPPPSRTPLDSLRSAVEMAKYVGGSLLGKSDITVQLKVEPAPVNGSDAPPHRARGTLLPVIKVAKEDPLPHLNASCVTADQPAAPQSALAVIRLYLSHPPLVYEPWPSNSHTAETVQHLSTMKGQLAMYSDSTTHEENGDQDETTVPPTWSPLQPTGSPVSAPAWTDDASISSDLLPYASETEDAGNSNGNTDYADVARRAEELALDVLQLVDTLQGSEASNTAMLARIRTLEETARQHATLTQALHQLPFQVLEPTQLESVQSLFTSLREDPERLSTLVKLSSQAETLDDIINNYVQISHIIHGL